MVSGIEMAVATEIQPASKPEAASATFSVTPLSDARRVCTRADAIQAPAKIGARSRKFSGCETISWALSIHTMLATPAASIGQPTFGNQAAGRRMPARPKPA